jgi:hypothetical protein
MILSPGTLVAPHCYLSYPQLIPCLLELLLEEMAQEDSKLFFVDGIITIQVQMSKDMLNLLFARHLSANSSEFQGLWSISLSCTSMQATSKQHMDKC